RGMLGSQTLRIGLNGPGLRNRTLGAPCALVDDTQHRPEPEAAQDEPQRDENDDLDDERVVRRDLEHALGRWPPARRKASVARYWAVSVGALGGAGAWAGRSSFGKKATLRSLSTRCVSAAPPLIVH